MLLLRIGERVMYVEWWAAGVYVLMHLVLIVALGWAIGSLMLVKRAREAEHRAWNRRVRELMGRYE